MNCIKKLTNGIHYRLLASIFVVTVGASLFATTSGAFAQSATVDLSATLTEPASFVNVDGLASTTLGFGPVAIPVSGTSYFGVGGVEVTWKAPNGSNFHIDIKTDNAADADGMVDDVTAAGANSVPLRFNNPDLGVPIDVNSPTVGEWGAIYGVVKDADNSPFTEFADETLGYSKVAGTNFNLNVAIEVASTAIAAGYTAPITLDLVIE